MLIVSSYGILVERDATSRLAIKYSGFYQQIPWENSKLFLTVKLGFIMGSMRGTKSFAKF